MKITAHNRDDKSGRIEIEPETDEDADRMTEFYCELEKAQIKWWFKGARKCVVVTELQ